MIEDKTPMYLTLPGHILLNKELDNIDALTYALIVALEPLREDREITLEDVAEILSSTPAKITKSIKRLLKEEYLESSATGLRGYWS